MTAATIEQALHLLNGTGPEFDYGLSNHGPMLADALISLDRAPLVMPWLERYKSQLNPSPTLAVEPIAESAYHAALGRIDRYFDWQTFFRACLEKSDWKVTLNTWVDNLSPGYIAAAMHGVIRVGHAVRTLSRVESETTLNELADGLAYWAARYQPLPEVASAEHSFKCSISDALSKIDLLPDVQREDHQLIFEEVEAVGRMQSFPEIINLVEQDEQPAKVLSNLTEAFASVFVSNAEPSKSVIALVHSVTGPYALRHMLLYLEEPVARKALRYAWQASAALYVRYGVARPVELSQDMATETESELIEKAIATQDEHAVKFVEACLTEHGVNKNPIYHQASVICSRLLSFGDNYLA